MATDNKGGKRDKNTNRETASRLAYLRSEKFVTAGFGSNERIPSISEARAMDGFNKRLIARQRPMPSVKG